MHPNGHIPAYEWAFSDVNPPVKASLEEKYWGRKDKDFLERIFQKLLAYMFDVAPVMGWYWLTWGLILNHLVAMQCKLFNRAKFFACVVERFVYLRSL